MSGMARILMCGPDYFDIRYEINPWMRVKEGSDSERAQEQWLRLVETLREAGATIELMEPVEGLPDLVFTANAGLVYGDRFLLSRFRYEVRQRETPHFERWFESHGYRVETMPEGSYFEGAGDALFCGETLFCRVSIPKRCAWATVDWQGARGRGVAFGAGGSAVLPHRHVLLSPLGGCGDLLSSAFRLVRAIRAAGTCGASDRGAGGGSGGLLLQCGGGGANGGGELGSACAQGKTRGRWVRGESGGTRRVSEGGRIGEVLDLPTGWRGCGDVGSAIAEIGGERRGVKERGPQGVTGAEARVRLNAAGVAGLPAIRRGGAGE